MKTILMFFTTLLVACVTNIYSQINLDSGLIAYYPLNGSTQDFSGNNHNGAIVGSPVVAKDRFNNTNGCYWFNGNGDYIRVKKETSLEPKDAVSVSAWVYADDLSSWLIVASKRLIHSYSPGNSYILFASGTAGQPQYWAFGVSSQSVETFTVDENVVQTKQWVHLTGTYDKNAGSGNIKLYVNGNLISKATAGYQIAYSDSSLRIGMAIPGPSKQFFKGRIDEVRIYNRALSQEEITELYNRDSDISTSTLQVNREKLAFEIYPNPAETELTIEFSEAAEYKAIVYDITGKEITEKQFTELENVLDISMLQTGLYYLKIIDKDNVIQTKKFIKN